MARSNGGITGVSNKSSFGKCKVTKFTSSGTLTTQPTTRNITSLVVAGGVDLVLTTVEVEVLAV